MDGIDSGSPKGQVNEVAQTPLEGNNEETFPISTPMDFQKDNKRGHDQVEKSPGKDVKGTKKHSKPVRK